MPLAALTIAGSDSGGGAGIQADLKTFAAHGVYGTCAVTAVTAQNTTGVRLIHELPADVVAAQIDAVLDDIEIHAVKIGMLASAAIVRAVVTRLSDRPQANVVLDPVIAATSGARLLTPEAVAILRSDLLPLARVVTPNAEEAGVLTGLTVSGVADARRAAERLRALGASAVIVTGGHLDERDAVDVICDDSGCLELRGPRVEARPSHGTGCTFAAAVAANLAHAHPLRASAELAKHYVADALRHTVAIGRGRSPLDHFWNRHR
jgi:hydroxymethylpyrimidine/phosphomethylpyrimidine kinase